MEWRGRSKIKFVERMLKFYRSLSCCYYHGQLRFYHGATEILGLHLPNQSEKLIPLIWAIATRGIRARNMHPASVEKKNEANVDIDPPRTDVTKLPSSSENDEVSFRVESAFVPIFF